MDKVNRIIIEGKGLILSTDVIKKAVENKKTTSNKIEHIVKEGDTLESISKKYKTNVAKLKKDNKKKSNFLKIGEKIEIYK
jgi:membrane-bound lytic murein transglycosylase D